MTDDSRPMPAPAARKDGRNIFGVPTATPGAVTATAATHIAMTRPDAPGRRWPAALDPRMYAAHAVPAAAAQATPAQFSRVPPTVPASNTTPAAASAA
jgi:hypothetical protein